MIFFIAYELDTWSRDLNSNFTLKHCLFGGVKLGENADPNKCVYSGYGNGFDVCSIFSLFSHFFIFGVYMSSSVHIDNKSKKKDILILGEGPRKGLDDTTLRAEAKYFIDFSALHRKICLNLHHNGSNSFLFVSATKIYQFKAK